MSYILDALKRAERERQAGQAPVPPGAPPPAGTPRRSIGPRAVGIAALVIAAVALGGWWLSRKPADTGADAEAVDEPVAMAPPAEEEEEAVEEEALAAEDAPVEETPAVIPGTEDVTSLDDLATDTEVLEDAAAAPEPAPVPAPAPRTPVQKAPIATAPLAESPPPAEPAPPDDSLAEPDATATVDTPPAPAPTEAAPPRPSVPPALTQPAPLRRLKEMPPDYRADFPALAVDVHAYERKPEQRFALINGRKYRQGERLAEGPQLVEIVRDGLVLEFRGEKVLYPIGGR